MVPHADRLRDLAAKPTLQRISRDRKRVSEVLRPVLKTIEKHLFDDRLNVNFLWQKSKVARWRSGRFAKELGTTPADYIARQRVAVGAELLKATSLVGFQIAFTLGYEVYDTFSKAFKKRFGLWPSQYRAKFGGEKAAGSWGLEWTAEVSSPAMKTEAVSAVGEDDKPPRDGDSRTASIEGSLFEMGLHFHGKGAKAALEGDVDVAYEDLAFADQCYARAGELSPENLRKKRGISVSHMTDEALLAALCPGCRTSLVSSVGSTVRAHLNQALRLVPRDLRWFEGCCNRCYRTVWDALRRARLGLMDDAWKAWWLSTNVDPMERETPPSVGRVIAALVEVERLVSGDQLERKVYAEIAVEDATALGEPLLEAQARLWLGAVLGAMSQFDEARSHIVDVSDICGSSPWLSAMHQRMNGLLDYYQNHYPRALRWFEEGAEAYAHLDPHLSGMLLIQQANVHFDIVEYDKTVALNCKSLSFLDTRRDSVIAFGIVPIHLASAYCLLSQWDKAAKQLASCCYDRASQPILAATEISTRGSLNLLRGDVTEALTLFAEARGRFEKYHRPRSAALLAMYAVEAHVRLDQSSEAIETAMVALHFFEAAGCSQDTINTIGQLHVLLEAESIDTAAVVARVRQLARQHGGWLPDLALVGSQALMADTAR